MAEFVQIITTCERVEDAKKIGEELVKRRLCPCAQVSGPISSIYWWEGSVEKSEEWYCIAKAREERFKEVERIEPAGNRMEVQTAEEKYSAYAVIIASGSIPKKLNIPGEREYTGKGVSYCATCDGPLYRDKDVAVIGCGNSGLQEGESLLNHARSVTFVELLPHMTAERILQERLQRSERTDFLLNHMLTSINGEESVSSMTVRDRQTDEEKQIAVSGVFIYAGLLPNSRFLEGVAQLDHLGYVVTDETMETSIPGIYAVGDVRSKKVRQIAVACGEGTIAAISARDHIMEHL